MKKKISFKLMALLLVLSSMYAFGGCNQGGNDLYSGIVISQEQPHTQETEAYAETVIFSMLKSALGIEPNDKATEKMQGIPAANGYPSFCADASHFRKKFFFF